MSYNSQGVKARQNQGYPQLEPIGAPNLVGRWTLDGTFLDSVGSENITGTPRYAIQQGTLPLLSIENSQRQVLHQGNSLGRGIANAQSLKIPEITVAAWVCVNERPGNNVAVFGFRGGGSSGSPDNFNFAWEISSLTTGQVRFLWQSGLKTDNFATAPDPLDLYRWYHVIGSRDAAQDRARIYVDGVLQAETTGLSPHNGGTSQNTIRVMQNSLGTYQSGALAQVIVLDKEFTPDEAMQLYQSSIALV